MASVDPCSWPHLVGKHFVVVVGMYVRMYMKNCWDF